MTEQNNKKSMTDAQANALVCKILKRGRPVPQLGYADHTLSVGNKIYLFIDYNEIHIKETLRNAFAWIYKMDDDTKELAVSAYKTAKEKYEQKKKRRSARRNFIDKNFGAFFACGVIICVFGGGSVLYRLNKPAREAAARDKAIKAQVDEYAATLPNYNDSIRLAKTNEELQNAINRREQARLKIAHYGDSLRAISR